MMLDTVTATDPTTPVFNALLMERMEAELTANNPDGPGLVAAVHARHAARMAAAGPALERRTLWGWIRG